MRLADARVLVTGASGGIGGAVATRLHAAGAQLILHGRDGEQLAELADAVGARIVTGDLGEPDGPALVAKSAGPLDVLVHCAGIGLRGPFAGACEPDVERVLAVNLRAPLLLTRAVLPAMLATGRGHLAYIGSIAGLTGVGQEACYAATKAGLLTFADSLRLELAGTGVTVSTISPGAVETGFWDARGAAYHRSRPRPLQPERVAELLVHDIEAGRSVRVVPRWLGIAPAFRALAPRIYRGLARRLDGT